MKLGVGISGVLSMLEKSTFKCSKCGKKFPWFMRGGTRVLIADQVGYSDRHIMECAYCVGWYADGTRCNGGGM